MEEEPNKAAIKYCPDDAYPFGPDIINKEVRKAFIAGWKAKEESEKPVPNDLEEAAENIYKTPFGTRAEDFKAGAEWQKEQDDKELSEKIAAAYQLGVKDKEQMMKEAVEEVKVGMRGEPIEIILDKYVQRAMGIFPGDKVRIIVLKNTEK